MVISSILRNGGVTMRVVQGIVIENGIKVKKKMVLEDKICVVCGNAYEPYTQDARCCSKKCYRKDEYERKKEIILQQRKEYRAENLEREIERSRDYYQNHKEQCNVNMRNYYRRNRARCLEVVSRNLDEKRHGGKRQELIDWNGAKCFTCGKVDKRIAAHHVSLDKTDHENQILLCNSCHSRLHNNLRRIAKQELAASAMGRP
jgi:predicted nucleic acid-binding Zn ribbon protein